MSKYKLFVDLNFKNITLSLLLKFVDFFILQYRSKFLFKLKKLIPTLKAKLIYVVEEGNWAIEWVGIYITRNLKKNRLINAEIGSFSIARNKLIHFGSINVLITQKGLIGLKKSNKYILTWFHINPSDMRIKFIPLLNKRIDKLHTSNIITKKKLIELGFDEKKIVVIPLGVDLSHFIKYNEAKKKELKKKFNLPENKVIIGSFQKDGVGWGEGLKPKLIKGPDIFVEVIKRINEKIDIHIFLTGPARGYVKKKLEENHIPYTHLYLKNFLEIVECYNVLNLILITSRAEGGPKALLEGMATGVPIVTTKVGMATNIIKHGINGYIADIDDIDQLCQYSEKVLKNKEIRQKFIKNGLRIIKKYNWEDIAKRYYLEIYKNLMRGK